MDKSQQKSSLLTFQIGPYCFCAPAVDVEAIITMPDIRSLPFAPNSVAGLFLHRGQIATVISMRRKFGLKEQRDKGSDQLIMSRINSSLKGFWVDKVLDIIPCSRLSWSTVSALSPMTAFDKFGLKEDEILLATTFVQLYEIAVAFQQSSSVQHLAEGKKSKLLYNEQQAVVQAAGMPSLSQSAPEENSISAADKVVSETDALSSQIEAEKTWDHTGRLRDLGSEHEVRKRYRLGFIAAGVLSLAVLSLAVLSLLSVRLGRKVRNIWPWPQALQH